MEEVKRCDWISFDKKIYRDYHDKEWGTPLHDDRAIFQKLILNGFQAGLSWSMILNKRENFRKAFDNFDFRKVARYDKRKVNQLLKNKGIIRNKMKIEAAINNARMFMEIRKEFGTFDKYLWQFVGSKPIFNELKSLKNMPAKTEISERLSKDLKSRGMSFVGPTIIYAFMQAAGMVNDHLVHCFRYKQLKKKYG
jgi:DNA-3-methyladenine glycosylase I